MRRVMLGFALVMFAASAASGASELEKFQRKVEKFAVPNSAPAKKIKGLCLCREANELSNTVGTLSQTVTAFNPLETAVRLTCRVRSFVGGNEIDSSRFCADFVPLAK